MRKAEAVFTSLAFLCLLVVGLAFKAQYDAYQQKLGQQNAELAQLRPLITHLHRKADSLETELAKKVPIAYRTKVVWGTLPPLIPQLQLPDAPPVPASQLAKVILIGQEAIESCHQALNPCLLTVAAKDSIITAVERQRDIYKSRVPNRWDGLREWGWRILAFEVGRRIR